MVRGTVSYSARSCHHLDNREKCLCGEGLLLSVRKFPSHWCGSVQRGNNHQSQGPAYSTVFANPLQRYLQDAHVLHPH